MKPLESGWLSVIKKYEANQVAYEKARKLVEFLVGIRQFGWSDTILARGTGISRGWIIARMNRLRVAGLWPDTKTVCDPWNFDEVFRLAEGHDYLHDKATPAAAIEAIGNLVKEAPPSKQKEVAIESFKRIKKELTVEKPKRTTINRPRKKIFFPTAHGLVCLVVVDQNHHVNDVLLLPEKYATEDAFDLINREVLKGGRTIHIAPFRRVPTPGMAAVTIRQLNDKAP